MYVGPQQRPRVETSHRRNRADRRYRLGRLGTRRGPPAESPAISLTELPSTSPTPASRPGGDEKTPSARATSSIKVTAFREGKRRRRSARPPPFSRGQTTSRERCSSSPLRSCSDVHGFDDTRSNVRALDDDSGVLGDPRRHFWSVARTKESSMAENASPDHGPFAIYRVVTADRTTCSKSRIGFMQSSGVFRMRNSRRR